MPTDIAFAVGLLTLVASRVPDGLRTFLTALATVDDIGAILVIAFFLTPDIETSRLFAAGIFFGIMLLGNIIGVRSNWFYFAVGIIGLWVSLLFSGIHATLAGVLAAITIPARTKITERQYLDKLSNYHQDFNDTCLQDNALLTPRQVDIIEHVIDDSQSALTPSQHLERRLVPLVYYVILPLFALSNAGVPIEGNVLEMLSHPLSP